MGTQVSILVPLLQSMLQRSMGTSTVQRTEYKYKYSSPLPLRIFLPANPSVRIPSYMYTQTLAPRLPSPPFTDLLSEDFESNEDPSRKNPFSF